MMLLMIALLLLSAPTPAPDSLFAEGNARYDAGDYAAARNAYLGALDEGHASAALYLNLAAAYYRLDSLGQSVRYLEKARALSPDDLRVQHNLRIVRARLGIPAGTAPPPYWETGATWLHRNAPPLLLFEIGLVLFVAALTLAAWRLKADGRSPWTRRGLLVLLPPALLLIVLAFAVSAGVLVADEAVVLRPVELEPPGDRSGEVLAEGRVVRIVGRAPGRVEVALPEGSGGWIAADAVGDI